MIIVNFVVGQRVANTCGGIYHVEVEACIRVPIDVVVGEDVQLGIFGNDEALPVVASEVRGKTIVRSLR